MTVAQCAEAGREQLAFDFVPQRELVVQPHEGQLTSDAGLPPVRRHQPAHGDRRRGGGAVRRVRAAGRERAPHGRVERSGNRRPPRDERPARRAALVPPLRRQLLAAAAARRRLQPAQRPALRDHPDLPRGLRAAQPQTWRTRVIKVAAAVVQSTRRAVIRLAGQWPCWDLYLAAARRALAFHPAPAPTS
jgi:hypothetical protein